MTGTDDAGKVTLKRFLMLSMLSSVRPSWRPSSRFSMTSSGQSRNKTKSGSEPVYMDTMGAFCNHQTIERGEGGLSAVGGLSGEGALEGSRGQKG